MKGVPCREPVRGAFSCVGVLCSVCVLRHALSAHWWLPAACGLWGTLSLPRPGAASHPGMEPLPLGPVFRWLRCQLEAAMTSGSRALCSQVLRGKGRGRDPGLPSLPGRGAEWPGSLAGEAGPPHCPSRSALPRSSHRGFTARAAVLGWGGGLAGGDQVPRAQPQERISAVTWGGCWVRG